MLPIQWLTQSACLIYRKTQAAWPGIVVHQGKTPKVLVTACFGWRAIIIQINDFSGLFAVRDQSLGKNAYAEIGLFLVYPHGTIRADRSLHCGQALCARLNARFHAIPCTPNPFPVEGRFLSRIPIHPVQMGRTARKRKDSTLGQRLHRLRSSVPAQPRCDRLLHLAKTGSHGQIYSLTIELERQSVGLPRKLSSS